MDSGDWEGRSQLSHPGVSLGTRLPMFHYPWSKALVMPEKGMVTMGSDHLIGEGQGDPTR